MKMEKTFPRIDEPARFFITLDLMVGIVILMAIISVSIMLYGGLQFFGR